MARQNTKKLELTQTVLRY